MKALDLGRLGFRPRAKETLASMLARLFCQPHLSVGLTSNSRDRIKVVGLRNREENSVPPERCGIRMDKFAGLKSLGAFAPTFFRDVKIAESRRRRPPPTIARAKGGFICQLPGRSPSAAKTILWCHAVDALDTNYGVERRSLQRLFRPFSVSGISSVNVCSLVSRTTDEMSTSLCVRPLKR